VHALWARIFFTDVSNPPTTRQHWADHRYAILDSANGSLPQGLLACLHDVANDVREPRCYNVPWPPARRKVKA